MCRVWRPGFREMVDSPVAVLRRLTEGVDKLKRARDAERGSV